MDEKLFCPYCGSAQVRLWEAIITVRFVERPERGPGKERICSVYRCHDCGRSLLTLSIPRPRPRPRPCQDRDWETRPRPCQDRDWEARPRPCHRPWQCCKAGRTGTGKPGPGLATALGSAGKAGRTGKSNGLILEDSMKKEESKAVQAVPDTSPAQLRTMTMDKLRAVWAEARRKDRGRLAGKLQARRRGRHR